jgi:hypothetical protein
VLKRASSLISGSRDSTYGHPAVNLGLHGALIEACLDRGNLFRHGPAHAAAIIQALSKIARIVTGSHCQDNYDDLAGYTAIASELVHVQSGINLSLPGHIRDYSDAPPFDDPRRR